MQYAVDNGMLDLAYVQEKIKMSKREELLNKHPYKIWKGTDGRWHTYLPNEKKGRIPRKRNTLEEIQQVVVDYWKQEEENPTIEEVFNEWNDRRLNLKKISGSTHARYRETYIRHFKEFGEKRIKTVTEDQIEDFLEEEIAEKELTAKGFAGLKLITKGMLKRAKKRKLIDFNVEQLFQEMDLSDTEFRKNVKEDWEEVYTEEETPIIMDYLINHLDVQNLAILLMFVTGLRVGEVSVLKNDVINKNTIRVQRTESKYRNSNGEWISEVKEFPKTEAGVRTVVIPDDYLWIIRKAKQLNPFSEWLFTNSEGGRLTAQAIRNRLKRVCKKVGMRPKSPHKIRKTYCSILLDNDIDRALITRQVGHTDISCTENFYHRNRRNSKRVSEILSNVPEFKNPSSHAN